MVNGRLLEIHKKNVYTEYNMKFCYNIILRTGERKYGIFEKAQD